MKAKYYPHITIFGGAVLLVAPLCLVLSLSQLRSQEYQFETAILDTSADLALNEAFEVTKSAQHPEHSDLVSRTAFAEESENASESAPPEPSAIPPRAIEVDANASTRVAMLPDVSGAAAAQPFRSDAFAHRASIIEDTNAVLDMATIDELKLKNQAGFTADAPSVPIPDSLASAAEGDTFKERSHDSVATVAAAEQITAAVEDEFVEPVVTAESHFDATAHLSMRGGGLGTTNTNSLAANTSQKASSATGSRSADKRKSGRRSARTNRDRNAVESMAASGSTDPQSATDTPFGATPQVELEDIILQQPLESRRVDRMENVVAVTKAKGWPIALVRSDLPDDYWWVQQMVGIRGNAFAARVNFGNDDSISGSVYHMVFVFLDSPDEVRRFRIAKQFKKLPEGIRHSREFTFVRR